MKVYMLALVWAGILQNVHGKKGHIITAPRQLHTGRPTKVCAQFYELEDSDVSVNIQLIEQRWGEDDKLTTSATQIFEKGTAGCLQLEIPSKKPDGWPSFYLNASVTTVNDEDTNAAIYRSKSSRKVQLREITPLVRFIETDKPIYKPGQRLMFRVLTLTREDLKPQTDDLDEVTVMDPTGSRLRQWKNTKTEKGLASFEMPLSEEPVLGTWTIKTESGGYSDTRKFDVKEYVLPKFEVLINPPAAVLINATSFDLEICAKYTYGKPVKGKMFIDVDVLQQSYYGRIEKLTLPPPVEEWEEEIDGCVTKTIQVGQFNDTLNFWGTCNLNVLVMVKEDATGVVLNATHKTMEFIKEPFKIDLEGLPKHFKPGMPFTGNVHVNKPDGSPVIGEQIELEIRPYAYAKFAKNFTTDSNGGFHINVLLEGNETTLNIKARAPRYDQLGKPYDDINYNLQVRMPIANSMTKRWYSPSQSFIQVEPIQNAVACDESLRLKIDHSYVPENSDDEIKLQYQVMSRGNILKVGTHSHKVQGHLAEDSSHKVERFHLTIPVTSEMSPKFRVLVYYVRADGETVADSATFTTEKCLPNMVSARFADAEKRPGDDVTMNIVASPDSLCSVGVVDKSLTILKASENMDFSKVFGILEESDSDTYYEDSDYEYCEKKLAEEDDDDEDEDDNIAIDEEFPPLPDIGIPLADDGPAPPGAPVQSERGAPRKKRSYWRPNYSDQYDAIRAFQAAGLAVLSDLEIETRPCLKRDYHYGRPMALPMLSRNSNGFGPSVANLVVETGPEIIQTDSSEPIRAFFPETWLWRLETIGSTGEGNIDVTVPDTITEWVGNAFCTNSETGLGISQPIALNAFQPFFVSFTLPYAVVRGEKVPVIITVFNYLKECLMIKLSLEESEAFTLEEGTKDVLKCVCGGQAVSHSYLIAPTELGQVNITVKAVSTDELGPNNANSDCDNNLASRSYLGVQDAAVRPLLVEAEGVPQEYTETYFVCPDSPEQGSSGTITFKLPENAVPDSERAYVTAIGDLMGPTLSNIAKLIRLPTGCGEQTMLSFAPNIYIMEYLQATNQLTDKLKETSEEYMIKGYQRELTYRHDDGTYSAFGKRDDSGSTWLTAFVVKSFARAQKYITVDKKDLDKSVKWFVSQQNRDGCFPSVGKVLHKDMKGGLSDGGSGSTLTAYVTVALLEAGLNKTDRSIRRAVSCMVRRHPPRRTDKYGVAMVTYALMLENPNSVNAQRYLRLLNSLAVNKDGMKYWQSAPAPPSQDDAPFHKAKSADVEITSYALLSLLLKGGENIEAEVMPIVRWISRQRNSRGGFASTQDTVVALQALAQYAALVYGDQDITVALSGSIPSTSLAINSGNSLLLQKVDVPSIPSTIETYTSGTGCALLQGTMKYNIFPEEVDVPAFQLRVNPSGFACKKQTIKVCTSYQGPGDESNMAVIEVKMPSGWSPLKETVEPLLNDIFLGLKRYEVDKNFVSFYFDSISSEEKCLSFVVEQSTPVKDLKPASVMVYDYYDTDLSLTKLYSLNLCQSEEQPGRPRT
ncbi:unnamed protein product [Owenia fusiformis]|uniref:Alpha-2-macroglobulin n=1 Tax=Owenia fusiformis TaxID=6347 RepID=A0A8S4PVZ6_OWEFU|nr:unnamed protein product [Owenia fusiformis]